MPRIRTIKPEFWSDEKLSSLDPVARLVFLGLICMADDAGRLLDNVKQLDGMIFPTTSDSTRESLATLARLGRIIRYTSASGQELIQITKWKEHQRVDKPAKYVLPGPTSAVVAQAAATASDASALATPSREPPGESREDLATSSRSDLRPTTYDHGPTTDDQRAERLENSVSLPPAAVEFGRTFYRTAPRDRQRDVKRQLRATLNGGARLKGERVLAGSPARLEAKCREVMAEGVKNPDRAIVVLLTKLGDVSDDSPTDRAAAATELDTKLAEGEGAHRLALALAWLEHNADVAAEIDRLVDAGLTPGTMPAIRAIYRNAAITKAWRDAGEPVLETTAKTPEDQ